MKLLHLDGPEAIPAVKVLMDCCTAAKSPTAEIIQLLNDPNWRLHLVAGVALTILPESDQALDALWMSIDSGSWVTPQLAVVAFLQDTKFADKALERLRAGCPIKENRAVGLSAAARHSAADGAGNAERSAKAAAALLHLVRSSPSSPKWATDQADCAPFEELAAKDVDRAAFIAQYWRNNLLAVVAALR